MQAIECSERYTNKGHYAVMTRTRILNLKKLTGIAEHFCRNAEVSASTSNPPIPADCRIAGAILGWTLNLAPIRIGTTFDD
jgi:hypothetical protein